SLAPPELQDIPDLELDAATISVGDYLHVRRSIFRPIAPKCIAVIEVLGTIVSKEPMEWLPMAVESHICEALREARTNPKVAGAVVFIDSRGGSASASQKILHEVRALAKLKPVVACMGDNAASGGYMVAAGAHSIVAQPTTVTGSIGVVSARVAASKLLDRVGVKMQTIKRGKHANIMSVARNLEPSEKEVLDRMMGAIYKDFVEAVAVGRGKEPADIEPLASGRVWIGSDALDNGLVDMMGGFETALSKVRELVASSTGKKADSLKPALFEVRSMPSLPTLIRGFLPGMVGRGAGVVWDLIALATVQGVAAWQGSPGSGSGDGAETRSESVWLWSPWGHC
ncbi:MAG: signal peptide peptidase SppA, partial [Polyangiaceae bacterium]|nr:signal peptide peptidase SppA [Polyangiaceae bacterium]